MTLSKHVVVRALYRSPIAALAIVLLTAGGAFGAPPTPVTTCGQVLSTPGEYMLATNLTCGGTAIVITGDSVRFNLAGLFLAGNGTGSGIEVSLGSRVRIRNGTIRNFGNGIRLDTSNSVRVSGMVLAGNGDGLQLHASDNNGIGDSQITANIIGVRIDGSDKNTVSNNLISNNVADPNLAFSAGVLVQNASTGNTVSANVFAFNGSVGVTVQGSDSNVIEHNTVVDTGIGSSPSPGITVVESSFNTVRANALTRNSFGIEISPGAGSATGNLVDANTSIGNEQGILILNGATSNTVQLNTATGNSIVDLNDGNAACAANVWTTNTFVTDLVAGASDGGPGVGCIQ